MNNNKLRAWDKTGTNGMIYPDGVFHFIANNKVYKLDPHQQKDRYLEMPIEVEIMLSMEHPDKTGRIIYQGDIIELINAANEKIRVVCEYGDAERQLINRNGKEFVTITGFYFINRYGIKTFPIVKNYLGKSDFEIFKIIGNIYETPKLNPLN
jgi:hypothetical protein